MANRCLLGLAAVTTLLVILPAQSENKADDAAAVKAADAAAQGWLAVVDAGDYGAAYVLTAPYTQQNYKKEAWVASMQKDRGTLGKAVKRKLAASDITNAVEGLPEGTYAVLGYQVEFTVDADSEEVVTLQKQGDGSWAVVLYRVSTNMDAPAKENDASPPGM